MHFNPNDPVYEALSDIDLYRKALADDRRKLAECDNHDKIKVYLQFRDDLRKIREDFLDGKSKGKL